MAKNLFHAEFSTRREVIIPATLKADARKRLTDLLAAAVERQNKLADVCAAVLRLRNFRVEGDVAIIEHDPAASLDPTAVLGSGRKADIGELWWFGWTVARAMMEAEKQKLVHGGLQLGAVLIDEFGMLKVTDFGIAVAVENGLREGPPENLLCEVSPGGGVSARWRVPSDEPSVPGWISPYFSRELYDGGALSLQSDDFAAGVLLYVLSTSTSDGPHRQVFEEPQTAFPIVAKPLRCDSARGDWKERLAAAAKGAVASADVPLVDWVNHLENGLLAAGTKERTAGAADFAAAAEKHRPASWVDALALIAKAAASSVDDAKAALDALKSAAGAQQLPAIWKSHIEQAAKRIEPRARLSDAERWLSHATRTIGDEYSGPAIDATIVEAEALRKKYPDEASLLDRLSALVVRAQQQRRAIAEQDKQIHSGYFESANKLIEECDFDGARQVLRGLIAEPDCDAVMRESARARLKSVDELEKKSTTAKAALERAITAARGLDFAASRVALDEIAKLGELPAALLGEKPAKLRAQIDQLEAEVNGWRTALASCDEALDAGEIAAAEKALAGLGKTPPSEEFSARRDHRQKVIAELRAWLARYEAAAKLAQSGKKREARTALGDLVADAKIPDALRERAVTLRERLDQEAESEERELRATAAKRFAEVEAHWQRGDEAAYLAAAAKLDAGVTDYLDANSLKTIEQRRKQITELQAGLKEAETEAGIELFDAAIRRLTKLLEGELPDAIKLRLSGKLDDWRTSKAKHGEKLILAFLQKLELAASHLDAFQAAAAAAILDALQPPESASDGDRKSLAELRTRTKRLSTVERELIALEALGKPNAKYDAKEFAAARDAAAKLLRESSIPEPGKQRMAAAERAIADRQKREAERRAEELAKFLQQSEVAIEKQDLDAARRSLAEAETYVGELPASRPRIDALRKSLTVLEKFKPRVEKARQSIVSGEWDAAIAETDQGLNSADLPSSFRDALQAIRRDAGSKLAAAKKVLAEEVAALDAEFKAKGAKTPDLAKRCATITASKLISDEQRRTIDAILAQYRATRGKGAMKIVGIAAGVVTVVGGGIGVMSMAGGPKGGGGNTNTNSGVVVANENANAGGGAAAINANENRGVVAANANENRGVAAANANENRESVAANVNENKSVATRNENADGPPVVTANANENRSVAAENRNSEVPIAQANANTNTNAEVVKPDPPKTDPCADAFAAARPVIKSSLSIMNVVPAEHPLHGKLTLIANGVQPGIKSAAMKPGEWGAAADGVARVSGLFALPAGGSVVVIGESKCDGTKWSEPTWVLADGGADALAAWLSDEAAKFVSTAVTREKLPLVIELVHLFSIERSDIPPPWSAVKMDVVQAGTKLDATGYPETVTIERSEYRLVIAVPDAPPQPIASERGLIASADKWAVYYIQTSESTEPIESIDAAANYAGQGLVALPTRAEWFIAAMTLATAQPPLRMFGDAAETNRYEWCRDADGKAWVMGGCWLHEKNATLKANTTESEYREWLLSPLVMQERAAGQGLIGARLVWRPGR
ncbi:MAG: hypothetical protein ACKVS9_19960 [Phycisphaerae bacterium]